VTLRVFNKRSLTFLLSSALVFVAACSDDPVTVPTDAQGEGITDGGQPDGQPTGLQHGLLGRYSALAARGGTLMASGYENTFGDLVFVSAPASDPTKLTKTPIDGVPSIPATKTGWRGGVVAPGDDVGQDTDIAITPAGDPMISYRDVTHNGLKIAHRVGGSWKLHTVETASGKLVLGRYTSLVMLGGKPAVAYLVTNLANTGGKTFRSELRWAEANKASPAVKADWTVSVVAQGPMPCRNLCDSADACVVKTDGSSVCEKKGTGCSTCATGEECVGTTCKPVLEDDKLTDIPWASGLWASAVVVSGNPVVFFYDRVKGNLMAASRKAGAWQPKVVRGSATDNVGAYCSAAMDSAKVLHVVYQDVFKATLSYSQVDAATLTAKLTETVDDGQRPDGLHSVGADPAIVIDAGGKPRVIYQDQQTSDLLSAKREGAGNWSPKKTTDADLGRLLKGGTRGYGFYSDLVLEGGKVYGSNFFFDAQAKPKGGFELFEIK
jgi:hypothetical protein